MTHFQEKTFNIPTLQGISAKNIEEHLKLYAGYVKHANLILEKIQELGQDAAHAYAVSEMQRRFGFEFCGLRNHEYYFEQIEEGAATLSEGSSLIEAIKAEWGSFDAWLARMKAIALTRGIGWAILYYDPVTKKLMNAWIDEQHLGQLTGLSFIFGIDMWEHSFVFDYQPSGKKQYVEDYFANVNWKIVEKRFIEAAR